MGVFKIETKFKAGDLILGKPKDTSVDQWAVWLLSFEENPEEVVDVSYKAVRLFTKNLSDTDGWPYITTTQMNDDWEWRKLMDLEDMAEVLRGLGI